MACILSPSAWVLIAANLIPAGGVLLFGWGVFDVLLLYWTENVVIGVFNVLRMLMAQPANPASWLAKLLLVPFFVVHYGMFTAVHGFFLVAFFQEQTTGWDLPGPAGSLSETLFGVLAAVIARPGALLVIGSLVLSHGYSFFANYLGRGENLKASLQQLMTQPYARIIVMHITIIGMGFLVILTGTRVVGVLLLVALKIGVDLRAHAREHRG
jgi:hypothetical protein